MPRPILRTAYLCIAWAALLVCDCALFAMGHEWASLRKESGMIWR